MIHSFRRFCLQDLGELNLRSQIRLSHAQSALYSSSQNTSKLIRKVSHPDPSDNSPSAKLIKDNSEFVLTTYTRPNVVFTRGKGAYLWDLENRRYIDFTAGIAVNALGHADPTIAAIIHDQALKLIHVSNLYHASQAGELARLIVETTRLSGGMQKASKVFFANSGTEANEGAIKFCRKVGKLIGDVKKHKIVSFTNSFHGRTMGSLSATPNPKYQAPFAPMVPGFVVGEYNKAEGIAELVTEETCGVIVEPIQGEGGVYQGSAEFLGALRERCTQVSAVLVFDEIQCGLGRTGKLWAHQYLPKYIQPDVLTMAKSLANGFPIGAILVGEDVAEAIKIGDHGTTFGGNPLACRVAHHTFSRLSSTELLQSVQQSSDVITSRLRRLQYRFPSLITEIRGRGLLLGVQLSVDPTHFIDLCRERGLLIISAGNNTLRIIPPLNIEPEPLRNGLDIIEEAFSVM